MKSFLSVGVVVSLLATGCASVPVSQVGQTAGTIAGAAIAPGIGAPIGALIGLLAGTVMQGQVDRSIEKKERQELARELGTAARPSADAGTLPPAQGELVRVWVDETMRDGRLTEAHFDVRPLHVAQQPHAGP